MRKLARNLSLITLYIIYGICIYLAITSKQDSAGWLAACTLGLAPVILFTFLIVDYYKNKRDV